ncbi:MAG: ATP-binding cassette domain-containing protein, partial [Clostridia bacterium]
MNAIQTTGLTKYYGKNRGIVDVDLTVEKGEFFGFIGPNGAGKSTTIRTLLGLIKPTEGTAAIFGKDIVKEKTGVLSSVGYLPSEAVFYGGMRVKDGLKLSADLRKKDCRAEARALCERLQLDPMKKINELSFGNRKKAAIVCALQHDPELLILDEPTGGLDPLMQREFFAILHERAEKGTTVFLSSHILSEIQRNCGRAAIIRDGRIIACGSVESLAKTGAKRVSVQGEADWSALEGICDFQKEEDGVRFLYNGDINELIRQLSLEKIRDLSVSEPDLEEIFLHYYTE